MTLQISEQSETPIYVRVAEAVCEEVTAGRMSPGDRLPPHTALAKQLGVSPLTVSRGYELLRNRGVVRRRRGSGTYIEHDALKRARSSRQRCFGALRVVLGETSLTKGRRETLFIATDLLDGIREVIGQREAHFVYEESFTRDSMPAVRDDDAVLLMCPRESDPTFVEELSSRGIPIVQMWSTPVDVDVPQVTYDERQAALAVEHLVACGYKRIGFIGVKSRRHEPIAWKFGQYVNVLQEAGLDVSARYVRHAPVNPGSAYAAAHEIIQSGDLPEAFFVDTDYKAMEVIRALEVAGLKTPDDIGIAAYDDIPEAAQFTPELTTVRVARREIGRQVAQMLVDWPTDGSRPDDITVESELVVRASTRCHVAQAN